MLSFAGSIKQKNEGRHWFSFLLQYLYFWRLVDFCGEKKSLSDILVWRLKSKKHENLVRTGRLPDRVKRSLFMLHPLLQTQKPLECTLGKSCQKKLCQKQPLIRTVTVIIIIARLKLMKNHIGIHPWNIHGKVPIPFMLLVISLWKSVVGVNVNQTPFSFNVSAKLIDRKKNYPDTAIT